MFMLYRRHVVSAQLTDAAACGDELFEPARDFRAEECSRVMYVLTLGSATRYRRRGIAKELLRRCVLRAEAEDASVISTARRPGETRRAVQIARGRTFLLQPRLAGVVIDLHLSTLRVLRLHRRRAPVMGAQDNRCLSRRAPTVRLP